MPKAVCEDIISFTQISESFPNDYIVVEIISIDYSKGEELGRIVSICDSFEEAVEVAASLEMVRTTILLGINCMNFLGGIA